MLRNSLMSKGCAFASRRLFFAAGALVIGAVALMGSVGSAQAVAFSTTFGPSFTFASNGTASDTVAVPTTISGDLTIDLTVIGDLDFGTENLIFELDGVQIGSGLLCNSNTADDPFSLGGTDVCGQGGFFSGVGTIAEAIVIPLIVDGLLTLSIDSDTGGESVGNFINITVATTLSGVTFPVTSSFAAGLGGTLSFETTAVPEPTTLTLFGVGLAGLGFMMWRRRKISKS